MAQIADKAGVADFRTHRLRDTFAVELLLSGVSIEDISVLVDHSGVQTTERYYAPWDFNPAATFLCSRMVRDRPIGRLHAVHRPGLDATNEARRSVRILPSVVRVQI